MKNISIKILSLLVLMTMTLSSCLNDLEDYMGDFSGFPATAEILNRPSPSGTTIIGFVDPTKKIDVTVMVSISRSTPMSVDTKVTMVLDNALITAFNTAKGLTGLDAGIPVPAAAMIFTSMDVTIPAGKYDAPFKFQVDPTKIVNAAALNIIPVKIASADNGVQISGNFGTSLFQILGRNVWDGLYTATAAGSSYVDYVSPAFGGWYPKTIHLITTGAYTCERYDAGEELNGYIFDTAPPSGALSYFGAWTPYFKFDAANNIVAVINSTADPLPRHRTAVLYTGAGAINKWDPATKVLDVMFYLSQENVTPVLRGLVTEHYVYVGPRPE
jgi:hypothetical protein